MTSGSLTVTTSKTGPTERVSLAWTASSGGAVSQPFTLPPGAIVLVYGTPAGTPETPPSGGYQVAITDPNGVSLIDDQNGVKSLGSSGSATNPFVGTPAWPASVSSASQAGTPLWQPGGTCTLTITGAGNAGQGTVDLYLLPAPF